MKVRDVMRVEFAATSPDATVLEAGRLMMTTAEEALPVVQGCELVGIIAERDILKYSRVCPKISMSSGRKASILRTSGPCSHS